MEATKKTTATRAALLVLAALSMLLSGLFIATASQSDATPPPACPDGFNLTADAKNCFQAAVVTSADNPNSCAVGKLTPDGSTCYVDARLIPQEGQTLCPKGYSPEHSLQDMCARFEPADQKAPTCPEGSLGVAGACYVRVAFGPRGAGVCPTGAVLSTNGTTCVITGPAPTNGPSSCPTSATVIKDANGECYTLVSRTSVPIQCDPAKAGYNASPYALVDGVCKYIPSNTGSLEPAGGYQCPTVTIGTSSIKGVHTGVPYPTHMKIGICTLSGVGVGDCPTGTTPDTGGSNDCRRPVDLVPGGKVCTAGYALLDNPLKCVRYESASVPEANCPQGSVYVRIGTLPDGSASAECRKPVADAPGVYYCKDPNAALNGKSCVWVTGFLINPAPDLYKCDTGGTRAVIGSGTGTKVICLLGPADANLTTGPSCLQGVLSTDNLYCIVPRIDTAPATGTTAPVPAFTG